MLKKSVLLINLGTPDQCDHLSVKRYLREFLNDPRMIDLPAWIRIPLVNWLIIPFRSHRTTKAYQKIWGLSSPLLSHSNHITQALEKNLGTGYQVELGMRYGKPSILSALAKFKSIDSLIVIPLFPQYSSAATGSSIEKVFSILEKKWNIPHLTIQKDFYSHRGFINAYAEVIKAHLHPSIESLIFSYHGLPEHHIEKSDCRASCDKVTACPSVSENNLYCYRAQCYATSNLIAEQLGYTKDQYYVSFQSRLGRKPWIKPYTDLLLPQLVKQGIKNIAMVSPSFVADCLETLEEVNIRTRAQWLALGGEQFTFIPCVNEHYLFIKALTEMVRSTQTS